MVNCIVILYFFLGPAGTFTGVPHQQPMGEYQQRLPPPPQSSAPPPPPPSGGNFIVITYTNIYEYIRS